MACLGGHLGSRRWLPGLPAPFPQPGAAGGDREGTVGCKWGGGSWSCTEQGVGEAAGLQHHCQQGGGGLSTAVPGAPGDSARGSACCWGVRGSPSVGPRGHTAPKHADSPGRMVCTQPAASQGGTASVLDPHLASRRCWRAQLHPAHPRIPALRREGQRSQLMGTKGCLRFQRCGAAWGAMLGPEGFPPTLGLPPLPLLFPVAPGGLGIISPGVCQGALRQGTG